MKDPIHYVNVGEKGKIIKTLAACLETGLASALKETTPQESFASCSRIEKTGLQTLLKSSSMAVAAVEVRFHTGLTGSLLLLIRTADVFRLGELVSGHESQIDDSIPEETMESCLRFVDHAVQASNARFHEQYGHTIDSEPPKVINPDGKLGSLAPLLDLYAGVLCLSFQVIVDPVLDGKVQVLVQDELFESLQSLIPDYDPPTPGKGRVEAQDAAVVQGEGSPSKVTDGGGRKDSSSWNIDLLLDVELPIAVRFGEAQMQLKDVLKLGVGSVIELDKSVNDPVVLVVNQKTIAKGEVVMVDGNYGVRILEVESTAERIRSLG